MVDFNESFNRILKKQIAKERGKQKRRRQRKPDTGNTEAGRTLVIGARQETMVAPSDGTFGVRIYKASPGAVKGRGRLGGIRK